MRAIIYAYLIFSLLGLGVGHSGCAFAEGGVVAIVNNEAITQKDLNDFINFMRVQMSAQYPEPEVEQRIEQMRLDLIDRLIEDRLILQAAYKQDIAVDQNRIKARIGQISQNYSSEEDFQARLMEQGLTLADIELKIKEQLLMREIIEQKVKSKITLKPQEITDYYSAHKQDFTSPEQRLVRLVVIKEQELAGQIEKQISRYGDLDFLAERHSLEITDLGWVTAEQLRKEVADAIFNSQTGKLSTFLDSSSGLYIFEAKEIKPSQELSLFEAQEEISHFLSEIKMQEAMVQWLEELKSEAYIEVK
jgi:peptidyl-prolyl cis-trans isomerase SurA